MIDMNIIETDIPDVKIIEPDVYSDSRGYFMESWNAAKYEAAGISCRWMQDNESLSSRGVVRGLHYQLPPYTQAKLVRVIRGRVLDIAVDIRRDSPAFGKYVAVILDSENHRQLFIPRGFAHGFAVLSDEALFQYKCDNLYMPAYEGGIAPDDPELNVNWHIPAADRIMSDKDRKNPFFKVAELFDASEYMCNA